MTESEILLQFQTTLVDFLDDLSAQFPTEGDLVIMRIFVKDRAPISIFMDNFVKYGLPYKKTIKARDGNFFVTNKHLFLQNDVDGRQSNLFERLWLSDALTDENRAIIWKWIDAFVYLAEKYQALIVKKTL
jgi:hypothetical protein